MVFLEWVKDLLDPCFDCHPRERVPRPAIGRDTPRANGHKIELAASPLAGLRGFAGYHTSVLIAGEEYYFSPCGICSAPRLTSHEASGNVERAFIGVSKLSGVDLLDSLTEYFRPGTYDLLRKNCNAFTDCALYFLCGERLDSRFCQIEQLGRAADDHARLIQVVSRGEYLPNERALAFSLEAAIEEIDVARRFRVEEDSDSCEWLADAGSAGMLGTRSKDRVSSKVSGAGYVSDGSSSSTGEGSPSSAGSEDEVRHPWLGDQAVAKLGTGKTARPATPPPKARRQLPAEKPSAGGPPGEQATGPARAPCTTPVRFRRRRTPKATPG